jgi:hypothetical protein
MLIWSVCTAFTPTAAALGNIEIIATRYEPVSLLASRLRVRVKGYERVRGLGFRFRDRDILSEIIATRYEPHFFFVCIALHVDLSLSQ